MSISKSPIVASVVQICIPCGVVGRQRCIRAVLGMSSRSGTKTILLMNTATKLWGLLSKLARGPRGTSSIPNDNTIAAKC